MNRAVLIAAGWGWAAAIVWLSLTPSPPQVDFEASDKLGHFGAYALLMLWFCSLYRGTAPRALHASCFIAMGAALEWLQGSLGTRSFEVLDMAANAAGVLAAWATAALAPRILAR